MSLSVFDLFTIGIGPSSSHSVGPMRAAKRFVDELVARDDLAVVDSIRTDLYGSLALTGKGHGTDKAVLLGLEGATPECIDPDAIEGRVAAIRQQGRLRPPWGADLEFIEDRDLLFHRRKSLPLHPNGMRFTALTSAGAVIHEREFYSIGGGFVIDADEAQRLAAAEKDKDKARSDDSHLPHPFRTGADLLRIAEQTGWSVSRICLENERQRRGDEEIRARLLAIWDAMQKCVERGCRSEGILPGGLKIPRRAPALYRDLRERPESAMRDPLTVLDWVDLYALAVNEENAAGGRVVTAPTNGAAGIVPAVLHYYARFCPGANDDGVVRFLLTAGAIAMLYKHNASISGAEVGCQGEVGVACSMAAGALAEVMGGTVLQVEQAAEIGMEHNLGLTCDPVGGLVQVPCIERNAMGAVKAINAARLALRSDGRHFISLDRVIAVMRRTGRDMSSKYKETSRGGLAVNVSEC